MSFAHLNVFIFLIDERRKRRNINRLRYSDDTTLMTESEEELKSLSTNVKGRVKKLA